jgi:hypothetical protein
MHDDTQLSPAELADAASAAPDVSVAETPVAEAASEAPAGTREQRLAERQRIREQKRINALEWVPQESTGVIYVDVTLNSSVVHRSFHVWYSRAQIASFFILEVLPRMADLSAQEEVEKIIDAKIGTLEKELSSALAQARAASQAAGLNVTCSYTKPRTLRVPKFTFEAGRFLNLIVQYDELLGILQALKISGHRRNSEVAQVKGQFRGKLTRLTLELSRLWVRSRRAVERERVAVGAGQVPASKLATRQRRKTTSDSALESPAQAEAA